MNKLFTSLAFGLCFTASQFAVAADGGFYGVAAVGQMVGKTLPTSVLEQSLIQYDGGVRNSKDTSLATNLSFGYALNRNTAVEGVAKLTRRMRRAGLLALGAVDYRCPPRRVSCARST